MRRARRRSLGSGEGRSGTSMILLWCRRPCDRWGSETGALCEYCEVRNRGKLRVSRCVGDGRVRNGSS